jgi:hypothetical protein
MARFFIIIIYNTFHTTRDLGILIVSEYTPSSKIHIVYRKYLIYWKRAITIISIYT